MTSRKVLGRFVAVVIVGACAGWTSRPASPAPGPVRTHPVAIRGFTFAPSRVTVSLGDTIAWTNEDIVIHTITGDTARWDSGDLETGKRYRVVASRRGTLSYHCELHPGMKGTLIIE